LFSTATQMFASRCRRIGVPELQRLAASRSRWPSASSTSSHQHYENAADMRCCGVVSRASGTARINRPAAAAVLGAAATIRALRPVFVHQTRPTMVGRPAGGYCLASQVAGVSHVFRVAVSAAGHTRARPGSNDPRPGRDSPGDQLNVAANMPGS
jgi:hypothetical protein